jgi:hypothetical protein
VPTLKSFFAGFMACTLILGSLGAQDKEKLTSTALIEKCLASIGTSQARSAIINRTWDANVNVIFRLGKSQGRYSGNGTITSEVPMIRYAMTFDREDYPGEQLVYDGKKVTEAILRPNVRSDLTKIVHDYDFLLKEGLLGGALSTSWCLTSGKAPKVDYRGIKKIDGKSLHELKILAKGSGNWTVFFYFAPETFRHVLSLYELKVQPFLSGNIDESARQADAFWRIREEFDNFQNVDGLTVPGGYKLVLTFDSPVRPFITEWDFSASQIRHNQQLDPTIFSIR